LFKRYRDGAGLCAADREELEALIRPTGFYRNKAASLIGLGQALWSGSTARFPPRWTSW